MTQKLLFDPNQSGLLTVFKPYQAEIVRVLCNNVGVEFSTKEMHDILLLNEVVASRASVINFLNRLAGLAYIEVEEKTGKGGYRGYYWSTMGLPDFKVQVVQRLYNSIREELVR